MSNQVETVMRSFLNDPVRISVRPKHTQAQIEQNIIRIQPGANKVDMLYELLSHPDFERVIVFGRTKHGINSLERVLSAKGLLVCSIHGNKNQNARQRALDSFKRGKTTALLATDVAARGIDIPDVTHVINYDEPSTYEDYTHRIGRTGRAGKVGKALTFVM
jgi:superfamily II DNA/RNA helicase